MEVKDLLKDKKFWFASVLIAWAAALQVTIFLSTPNLNCCIILYFICRIRGEVEGIVGVGAGTHDVVTEAGVLQAEVWYS